MIDLPSWAVPDSAEVALIDAGGVMRSPLNTVALRVDRPGSHYAAALTFPPFGDPAQGRVIVSRLIRAQREGLRVDFPLAEPQPVAGTPVVAGTAAGTTLQLYGLATAGQVIREGWWLSLVRADGQRFLHNVAADATVSGIGAVTLTLSEMIRDVFPNGSTVELVTPKIEGLVDGDRRQWMLDAEQKTAISFTIEEAA